MTAWWQSPRSETGTSSIARPRHCSTRTPPIPAHALLETYSVLTGFPPPYRAGADLVIGWPNDRFSTILEPPPASEHRVLISELARASQIGGSVYDALVGLTAKLYDAILITADSRASTIYRLIGIDFRPLCPEG